MDRAIEEGPVENRGGGGFLGTEIPLTISNS
jgi:hypothetical protein